MALIDKLKAIADGFRSSRGLTENLSLDEMATLAANNPPNIWLEIKDFSKFYASHPKGHHRVNTPSWNVADFSHGTNFSYMFDEAGIGNAAYHLTTLGKIKLGNGNYSGLFNDMRNLKNVELPEGATATNCNSMYNGCWALTNFPNVDTSRCEDFSYMFQNCNSLTIDVMPNIDTSNGTTFVAMFNSCENLDAIPHLNTSKGTNFYSMFSITKITNVSAGSLDISNATNCDSMFSSCFSLKMVSGLDVRNVQRAYDMFSGDSSLESATDLHFRNCTDLSYIFRNCTALVELRIYDIIANLDLTSATLLTQESVIHTIRELRNTGETRKLKLGTLRAHIDTIYVKLIEITDDMRTEDDLIDEKLPFEICESTDEGAMAISDYMALKNWTLY